MRGWGESFHGKQGRMRSPCIHRIRYAVIILVSSRRLHRPLDKSFLVNANFLLREKISICAVPSLYAVWLTVLRLTVDPCARAAFLSRLSKPFLLSSRYLRDDIVCRAVHRRKRGLLRRNPETREKFHCGILSPGNPEIFESDQIFYDGFMNFYDELGCLS